MSARRFKAGMTGSLQGIDWRIVRGDKQPPRGEDLVLQIRTPGWATVPFALGCLEADFFFENEDVLYPPNPPFRLGGRLYMKRLDTAVADGWQAAARITADERAGKEGHAVGDGTVRAIAPFPNPCPACRNSTRFWKRVGGSVWVCEACCPIERFAEVAA